MVAEIVKRQVNEGRRRELYFFRDQRGLEVDLVVPMGGGRRALLEIKASRTVFPEAARGLLALARSIGGGVRCIVVHAGTEHPAIGTKVFS